MSSPLVWLITGTSTGLGRLLTEAALKRGDKVIATARARSLSKLDDLKALGADTIELDVTDSPEKLKEVIAKAVAIHGRIDVLVNNAGYILVGAIEENTPEESMGQFNTHVFGALNVTRAVLPYMRERKTGTIVWMGSVCGWEAVVHYGLYCATKFTLRGISMSLQEEVKHLGIRSICLDFGYFRTAILNDDHRKPYETRIQDYEPVTTAAENRLLGYHNKQPGDPAKGVEVVLDVVRGEGLAKGKPWPVHGLLLGSDCYHAVKEQIEGKVQEMETWKDVTLSTDF